MDEWPDWLPPRWTNEDELAEIAARTKATWRRDAETGDLVFTAVHDTVTLEMRFPRRGQTR